jgi:hypothetical protein
MKKKQRFPRGWNEAKVRKVIAHYDKQSEDDEAAEIEGAMKGRRITMMAVPTELVPKVRALLARKRSA